MAKPRFPKKTSDINNTVSTPAPAPVSSIGAQATDAASTLTAVETSTAASRKAVKKPETVRSEPRANLVPINLDEEIRRLAYLLSERRGFQAGHETEDWLAAEREVRERYRRQSA